MKKTRPAAKGAAEEVQPSMLTVSPDDPRCATNMRFYYRSLDWADLWETFYLEKGPSGRHRWRSAWSFAHHIGQNEAQKDFLTFVMGPVPEEGLVPEKNRYPWLKSGPQSWDDKRRNGGWYSEQKLRECSKQIRGKMDALEALRETGNQIGINFLVRLDRLAQQLDEEMGGQFFVEGLTMTQNIERSKLYLLLHSRILSLYSQAHTLYAQAHGIDFTVPDNGFAALIAASLTKITSGDAPQRSRAELIIGQIAKDTLIKHDKYKMALPKPMTRVIEGKLDLDEPEPKPRSGKAN